MVSRRSLVASMTSLGLCLPLSALRLNSTSWGAEQPTAAVMADSLIEFLSVQTHLNWRNTVWDQDAWRPLLGNLGVRYTRSTIGNRMAREHLEALHRDYGIRSSATFNAIAEDGAFELDKTTKILDFLRDRIGAEKLYAIEGPNEYTHRHKTEGWAQRVRDYQEFLHNSVRSDAALKDLEVMAPTIWKRIVADYESMGDLSAFADFGNLHLYNAGRRPSRFNRNESDEPIDVAISEAQIVVPGKPICVTEAGFNVAANGAPTRWTVPADVAAKYSLRLLAELFLRREQVHRANLYSLIDDEHKDDHYGLLDAKLQPRPAYHALQNLIALLADPGPAFTPAPLTFALRSSSANIHSVLFQKRNGHHLLMVWQDAESYDRRNASAIKVDPAPAVLDLGGRSANIRTYMPLESGSVLNETTAASIELAIPDHLLIVEVSS